MSENSERLGSPWWGRMVARSAGQEDRAATPLELFFDLCFVVAVAQAAGRLHHALSEAHAAEGVLGYAMAFFAIWWAWMNFTWFASAYDTDDVPYRLATLTQMAGVLILAAGVPRAFDDTDYTVVTLGYVVMRLPLVAQWLRASRGDTARRDTARRYALGVGLTQVGWLLRLALPGAWGVAGFAVLVAAELAVPVWAERTSSTTWHPRHIAERYGLFTIIVLGESILAATIAIQSALDADGELSELAGVAAGGLLIVFSMWWVYFSKPAHLLLRETGPTSFRWGYGHYLVFASVAAVGAGIAVSVDHAVGAAHISQPAAAVAVTVPVAVYLLTVWLLHLRPHHRRGALHDALFPLAVLLVLGATFTPEPVLFTGVLLAALVAAVTATADPSTLETGSRPRP